MSTLIVPIDVAALNVSVKDSSDTALTMMGPMADFSQLPQVPSGNGSYVTTPYLASQVTKPAQPGPLPAGIHLHWALPAGLTGGTPAADGALEFPAVPNRWLITRISAQGGTVTTSFVVLESDRQSAGFTSGTSPEDWAIPPVTVPLAPSTNTPNFAYLGGKFALPGWSESSATRFTPLTAVGFGEPCFASFYPNCSSVFGFFDAEANLTPGATITYHVAGWYDGTTAVDPIAGWLAENTAQQTLTGKPLPLPFGWTAPAGATPGGCLMSGVIGGIQWQPETPGTYAGGNALTLALGGSTVEALSTLLASLVANGSATEQAQAEILLDALQLQTLAQNGQVLGATANALHSAGFSALPAGSRWILDPAVSSPPPLPAALAGLLNQLNAAQAKLDLATAAAAADPGRLFDLWSRLLIASYETNGGKPLVPASDLAFLQGRIADLSATMTARQPGGAKNASAPVTVAQAGVTALQGQIATALAALTPANAYTLVQTGNGPRAYLPNDPVVVLSGADVYPIDRYTGGLSGASLDCRIDSGLVGGAAVAIGTASYKLTATDTVLAGLLPTLPSGVAVGGAATAAVAEAIFLAPAAAGFLAGRLAAQTTDPLPQSDVTTVQSALAATAPDFYAGSAALLGGTLTSGGVAVTYQGMPPDPILVSAFGTGNPWLPMLMRWSASLTPLANGTAADYPADLLTGQFTFPADGIDLSYSGANPPAGPAAKFGGINTLSGQAAASLSQAISAWLSGGSDAEVSTALADLAQHSLLAQSLSGFMQQALTRQTSLQLPVWDPFQAAQFGANGTYQALPGLVGFNNTSGPEPSGHFNPLVSGTLSLSELKLIDLFGRSIAYGGATQPSLTVLTGQSLAPPAGSAQAFLPPRLAQPTSLSVGWTAPGGGMETSGAATASPVLAILLPGRAAQELTIYSPAGQPLVLLSPGSAGLQILVAPGSGFAADAPLTTVLAGQPSALAGLVNALAAAPAQAAALLAAIAEAQATILPRASGQMAGLATYAGQPLVLAGLTLSCSLVGPAAIDQSWPALTAWSKAPAKPPTAAVEGMALPVGLGLASELNDGLVGYWPVTGGNPDFATFYAPAGPAGSGVALPQTGSLTLTADGTPVEVLLLLDPRGSVSVATGLLPAADVSLPAAQYTAAAGALSLALPVGPVPNGAGTTLGLPLPALPGGGEWVWMAPGSSGWSSQTVSDATQSPTLLPALPQSLVEGWLVLNPTNGG